jgi:hypothetical protein
VLQVYGFNPGQSGALQEWYNGAGVKVANVNSDGTASFNVSTASSGIATAGPGFTINSQIAVINSGTVTIHFNLTRTGANISATATGDITTDPTMLTMNAAYRPNAAFAAQTLFFLFSTQVGSGSCQMDGTTGDVQLTTFSSGGTIFTGGPVFLTMTYNL